MSARGYALHSVCPHFFSFPCNHIDFLFQLFSVGYTTRELLYRWKDGNDRSIKWSRGLTLSQFDLTGSPAGNNTISIKGGELHRVFFLTPTISDVHNDIQ